MADPIVTELIALKRLVIFALLRNGASQAQIAAALGVNQSQVSRMFPDAISGRTGNRRKSG